MNQVVQHSSSPLVGIVLTQAARLHLIAHLHKQKEAKGLRFSVKKTGCSGFSYVLDYVLAPEEDDLIFPFDEDYYVYIDRKSYPFLKGLGVDYQKQGINSKLVFENPNQTGQCGCGESFTIE